MFELIFSKEAKDFLDKLDNSIKSRILKKIKQLETEPELGKPMTAQLAGFRSLRIGDYRAIYNIIQGKLIISVIKIGHRKNVY